MKKRNCRKCFHFYVCGYLKRFDHKLTEMLDYIENTTYNNRLNRVYNILAEKCEYFNKKCSIKK